MRPAASGRASGRANAGAAAHRRAAATPRGEQRERRFQRGGHGRDARGSPRGGAEASPADDRAARRPSEPGQFGAPQVEAALGERRGGAPARAGGAGGRQETEEEQAAHGSGHGSRRAGRMLEQPCAGRPEPGQQSGAGSAASGASVCATRATTWAVGLVGPMTRGRDHGEEHERGERGCPGARLRHRGIAELAEHEPQRRVLVHEDHGQEHHDRGQGRQQHRQRHLARSLGRGLVLGVQAFRRAGARCSRSPRPSCPPACPSRA
jgi:hypothetical protein